MNPLAIGGLVLWAASLWFAYGAGRDSELATQAREDAATERATDAALKTAAEVLAGIEVQSGQVRERITHEVRTDVRYSDCVVGPDGLRALNEAITGNPGAKPAGGGQLPAAGAASGPDDGGAVAAGR